ncbi:MAG: hypothetical protein AB8I08_08675 [Sandaracinaceae bacterium]
MKRTCVALSMVTLVACGTPEQHPTELEPAPGPAFDAEHGGVLIGLDGPVIEVVAHATGELHAHVRTEGDLSDSGLTLTLDDEGGAAHAVAMHWRDGVQGFVGQMESTPAAGEVEALLVRNGERHTGRTTIETVLASPEHEGSVLTVGEHTVEVVVDTAGNAHLYVLDDPAHRLEVDLVLNIGGQDGHLHPLAMVWDEETGHYTGHIEGMHPTPGPLEVLWSEGDQAALGQGSLLDVSALARPGAMGHDVPDDFRLDLPDLGTNVPAVIPVPEGGDAPTEVAPVAE